MRGATSVIVCCLASLLMQSAHAAQRNRGPASRDSFYRCTDKDGQLRYADRMPDECNGQDTEVLDQRGMVVRVIEGTQTRDARLKLEASQERERKEREEREQRDRMLIETYLTVADIERLRDQRLDMLDAQRKVTEQSIVNLTERQRRMEMQVARFKPYSNNPNAPPLPDHLAEEMVNTVNSLRTYENMLTENREEQTRVKAAFEADIKRFKELKGLK